MRREGRLHGYEFDREESHKRVKACKQPTNRSKFRSKQAQEKAGRPRYKALKKMKGQRNKAHASDVAANHNLHDWALHHPRRATLLADSIEEAADLDPTHQAPPLDAFTVYIAALAQNDRHNSTINQEEEEEEEEKENVLDKDSIGSDWLDLGSSDGLDDDWFLC